MIWRRSTWPEPPPSTRTGRRGPELLGASLLTLVLSASSASSASIELERYSDSVRFELSTGRYLDARAPDQRPAQQTGRLMALRDEVVALQLLVRSDAPARLALEVLQRGPEGPSAVRVQLFEERAVKVSAPSMSANIISQGPGVYPDILVPLEQGAQLEVPGAPQVAALWIDLWAPPDAQPGLHKLKVSIGDQHLELELWVLDLLMPRQDVARLGAVNFGSLLTRPDSLLRWMQMAHAHHLSVELLRPRPKIDEAGKIDWEGWAALVGPFVDGRAFTSTLGYAGPRAGLPTARFVLPHTDWWPSEAKDNLPKERKRFSLALAEWERFATKKGWFELPHSTDWVLFINSLDEPKTPAKLEALKAYEPLIEDARLQRRSRVLFRVDGNFGQRIEGYDDQRMADLLDGVVDLWNLHGAPWTIPWEVVMPLKAKGERVLFYASNTSGEPGTPPLVVDSAITGARAWGWIVWRYQLDGALNWEIDYTEGCIQRPRCAPGGMTNLDATLIFRGEELGLEKDRPIPSIRLKALRRGAQDAALLALLARSQPEVAARIARIVVPRALGDGVPDHGEGLWAHDPEVYERARQAILERLMKAPAPSALERIWPEGPPPLWWAHLRARLRQGRAKQAMLFGLVLFGFGGLGLLWRRRRASPRP